MGLRRLPIALLRRLRFACALFALLSLAAPCAFGGAMDPMLRLLGDSGHVCRCGMTPGKCGCLECALEQQRLSEHAIERVPSLENPCEQSSAPRAGALPLVALAGEGPALPVPRGERAPVTTHPSRPSGARVAPPTRPPRTATA